MQRYTPPLRSRKWGRTRSRSFPRGSRVIRPSHTPRKSFSSPSGATRATAQTNLAERAGSGTSCHFFKDSQVFFFIRCVVARVSRGMYSRTTIQSVNAQPRVISESYYAGRVCHHLAPSSERFLRRLFRPPQTSGMPGTSDSERNRAGSPLTRFRISWTFPWFVVAIRILSGILCIKDGYFGVRHAACRGAAFLTGRWSTSAVTDLKMTVLNPLFRMSAVRTGSRNDRPLSQARVWSL